MSWDPNILPLTNLYLAALLAALPLFWLMLAFGWLRFPAYRACPLALGMAAAVACLIWKMPAGLIAQAALEGAALGFWPIIWVIVAAIYTYNVTVATGSMETIKAFLADISGDRRIQALILALGFGGFLEAVAGFGTAVAIPAGILTGLGFEPVFAAILCLIANTVPVAYGGLGLPVITLSKVTNLPVQVLTTDVALQLLPFVLVLPFAMVLVVTRTIQGFRGIIPILFGAGLAFGGVQTLVAVYLGPELSALLGSLACLIVTILLVKRPPAAAPEEQTRKGQRAYASGAGLHQTVKAWAPYLILLLLIMLVRFEPHIYAVINRSPFVGSIYFYHGPGAMPLSFAWVNTPGTLMLCAAVLGGLVQGASLKKLGMTLVQTWKQLFPTVITVLSIVAMAKVMGYAGMVGVLALALAKLTGPVYPLIAPMLGALGTFLTGSDASSNILFGALQQQTALQTGADVFWITAANATGATAGKMISPQSIAVATAATGLIGKEGEIFRRIYPYCLVYVLCLGIFIWFTAVFV